MNREEKMRVAFYDTKGYDRDYFKAPADLGGLDLVFSRFPAVHR